VQGEWVAEGGGRRAGGEKRRHALSSASMRHLKLARPGDGVRAPVVPCSQRPRAKGRPGEDAQELTQPCQLCSLSLQPLSRPFALLSVASLSRCNEAEILALAGRRRMEMEY
jgi:hypothetical protein